MIQENISGRRGLMSDLSASCSSCQEESDLETSSTIPGKGYSADVNRRAVYHSVETGGGYESLVTFCSIMNMPCISKTAYYQHLDTIVSALEAEAKEEMRQAAQKLRKLILAENGSEDDGSVLDVGVSFDGTWAKRGFTSLIGVVFAISIDTGEVLDYHVVSKTCQRCALKKGQCENDEEFEDWEIEHVFSGECEINFNGSSPAMEVEGAKIVWNRSIELHNIRYKWMISDGDSKAFSAIEDTYDEVKVEKLDCVGHVQKRMGKNLLKLKNATKGKLADGKTVGGRGRLTEKKILQIQRYYGLAIRQNTLSTPNLTENDVSVSVYTMKKNIIALLNHSIQNEDPTKQHRFCPVGENSWCKWQQDCAMGTSMYKGDDCLPPVFLELLKPTFMHLSDSKLLERCVRGKTQNNNESINSLVWARCPKHKHHGVKVVKCAVASAVCHFHSGAASRERVMKRLQIPVGEFTRRLSYSKDKKRIRQADNQMDEKQKRRRQTEQLRKAQHEEALKEAEGVTYEPGGF